MISRKKRKLRAWQLGFNLRCSGDEVLRIAPTNGTDKKHRYYNEWRKALYSANATRTFRLLDEGRIDAL